ncbi:MAG: SPOR domain-containing protein [Blastocatellia bacterium]
MQLTATEATCPLCKHPVVSGRSDPTRLCEDCRRIVHTIRSTSSAGVAIADPPQERTVAQPPPAVPVQPQIRIADKAVAAEISSPRESAIRVGEPELPIVDPFAGVDRDPFDFDELFGDVFSGTSQSAEPPRHSREASGEDELPVSPAIAEPIPEAAVQAKIAAFPPFELEQPSEVLIEPSVPTEPSESDPEADYPTSVTPNGAAVPLFLRHEVVTDSLEDPVQSRNYSQEDHPVVAPGGGLSKVAKLTLSVSAAVVLCCGIAGYSLVYRPSIQASQTKQTVSEQTSKPATGGHSMPLPLPSPPEPGSEVKESDGLQSENENTEGRYALQAAAFPSETGATEFCERLKRAGVPAYVASADIAGRGRWFRVRVGRFESAEDANRFAAESRRRARASGLTLQLIVSSYDKP